MKIKSDINGERRRKMDEIAVLIPCFNEEITVGKVVEDFKRALPQATVSVSLDFTGLKILRDYHVS